MVIRNFQNTATENGFTLIELVMAVAIISGAFLSLLYLRTDAVDRAFTYNQDRTVRRLAREKLDEVAFGLEDALEGDLEVPGKSVLWPWRSTIMDLSSEQTGPRLLEITLILEIPGLDNEQFEEFAIATRILVAQDDPLATYAESNAGFGEGFGF
jgi:prepilin-type N-terminal cleavage/methylation domain-containing protein